MSFVWEQLDRSKTNPYFGGPQTLDKFEGGEVLVLASEGMKNGTQYYWNGITLTIIDSDASKVDDGCCQKEKLNDELFIKLASARMEHLEIDIYREANNRMMEVLKGNGVSLMPKDAVRLPKLNESNDLETVKLVHNILKERYNVDIQREGIQA